MEEINNQKLLDKKVWLNSLKIFAKILFAVVFVFFYLISAMFVLMPKFDVKIFSFFGLKKAEEACYLRIYEKSESNVDLYNLILFESKLENHEKELYYLNILLNDDDYVEFYKKLDDSAISAVKDKSIVAYSCNTNAYLVNQKIKCMYNLGFDSGFSVTISNYVKANLEGDNLFDSAFSTYVELINNDSTLTKEKKRERIERVYNVVDVLLTERLNKLQDYIDREDISLANKIIAQNCILNIRKADYLVDIINESADIETSKTSYEVELQKYNNLIK